MSNEEQEQPQERLERIAERLRTTKTAAGVNFQTKIVDEIDGDPINACVSSDNIISVTSLALDVSNDDELAITIGHEVGHLLSPNRKEVGAIYRQLGFFGIERYFFWLRILRPGVYKLTRELLHIEELYCDAIGMKVARDAGFNPTARVSTLLTHLLFREFLWDSYYLTHPNHFERIIKASEIA